MYIHFKNMQHFTESRAGKNNPLLQFLGAGFCRLTLQDYWVDLSPVPPSPQSEEKPGLERCSVPMLVSDNLIM